MSDKTKQKKLLRDRGICVIIPTFNNEGTLADVVRRTLQECDDVIVVDDGSNYNVREKLLKTPEAPPSAPEGEAPPSAPEGATIVSPLNGKTIEAPSGAVGGASGPPTLTIVTHDRNRGKGSALSTGFQKALELGFSYAITLDADGQHYPEDIPLFLEANRQHPGALIIGSRRMEGKEQSRGSRFANRFSNFWFYVQTGRRLHDTQTGYRLYPLSHDMLGGWEVRGERSEVRLAEEQSSHLSPPTSRPQKLPLLNLLTSRYEAELELLVFASWHGVELVPIDIDVYYPPAHERVSHFRPGKDFARISLLNTVLCFLAVVYGLPLRLWRWLMKYVRTLGSLLFFVFFSVFVFTPAVWLYVKLGPMTERKRTNIHRLLQWLSRVVMQRIGIPGAPFSSHVADAKAFDTPHIIICNHQSHLDLMCLMALTPKIIFLTNDWVWHNPFYGFIIRQAEYYPVSQGLDALLPRLRSLVERGYSIAVYPEGTRSPDCRIGRFHQGAFHIAQQLGLDILPACLYGPGKVLPKRSYTLHKSPIYIEVAQPIGRTELDTMGDTLQQARRLRQRYMEWYDDLCNRMERLRP